MQSNASEAAPVLVSACSEVWQQSLTYVDHGFRWLACSSVLVLYITATLLVCPTDPHCID